MPTISLDHKICVGTLRFAHPTRPSIEVVSKSLDHAEHDGADEGHGEVRGDDAQSPGERHEVAPSMRAALRAGSWLTESALWKKSDLLSLVFGGNRRGMAGMVKEH
ncbi:hypothetical protein [Bradyrhizobium sp. BR 10289]|uniref:hypothetical protein n=1 Tax=Bradyrhizobium sp. BR 10289 TaxID=2749993 RepID=UPI001C650C99|nr:hypothetical protein [Bradyrhizobium sp. BR 10289]MBW7970339.1 hypothetical protein [Bradyrhizobium sp. BR 10289]